MSDSCRFILGEIFLPAHWSLAVGNWTLGFGALVGYLLVLFTNPVRASLRDGLRCVRRYSMLWITLGAFGFAYALFQLALRIYFFCVLPPADRPPFLWARDAWRDPHLWL